MASETKQRQIDTLMEQASEALMLTKYFEAERLAVKALYMARQVGDFERMARIVMPLQEARRQRFQQAIDVGKPRIQREPVTEEMKVEPGIVVVQPPMVGSDARRLRLLALTREIPLVVLCREPLTQLKLSPIVALSPGATIRVRLKPAKGHDMTIAPPVDWIVNALCELGDTAVEAIDPTLPIVRRIDAILDRLDCLPEHENLHIALMQACEKAHQEHAAVTDDADGEDLEADLENLEGELETGGREL
ncbi:MAG TPA: hypothetical protein VG711_09115 [Phycisphaerales bacterium]|nr:hypothetical protein [Phycisphaerales bacterium]